MSGTGCANTARCVVPAALEPTLGRSLLASSDTVWPSEGGGSSASLSLDGNAVVEGGRGSVALSVALSVGLIARLPPNIKLPRFEKVKPVMNASSSKLSVGMDIARGANCASKSGMVEEVPSEVPSRPPDGGKTVWTEARWSSRSGICMEVVGVVTEPRIRGAGSDSIDGGFALSDAENSLDSSPLCLGTRLPVFLTRFRGDDGCLIIRELVSDCGDEGESAMEAARGSCIKGATAATALSAWFAANARSSSLCSMCCT
jgi:hypothetical protein